MWPKHVPKCQNLLYPMSSDTPPFDNHFSFFFSPNWTGCDSHRSRK